MHSFICHVQLCPTCTTYHSHNLETIHNYKDVIIVNPSEKSGMGQQNTKFFSNSTDQSSRSCWVLPISGLYLHVKLWLQTLPCCSRHIKHHTCGPGSILEYDLVDVVMAFWWWQAFGFLKREFPQNCIIALNFQKSFCLRIAPCHLLWRK